MVGSKDRVGSFELRRRSQDTVQGLISEAYIQQYFQEVFLQLFYEDPEFREQVLKCLLTGDNDEGTVQVSKPRRTWFNGMSGIQEVSREEARYLHICSENPSIDSDLSTEAGDERHHVALETKPAIQEVPTKHSGELKADASLKSLAKETPHSTVLRAKDRDMNQSGVPWGGNFKINYLLREAGTVTAGPESLKDRPQGPIPSEDASDSQHKSIDESLTSPCVHERRIQTWKANPLFLLSNIDSDSNDSWQHESPNVAWMDDLENGKMLQEVKMRKMRRLEESRPAPKAEGYDRSRAHSKSEHEGYIQCNAQGLPHHPTEEGNSPQVKGRKKLNEDQTGNPSTGGFVRAIPSFIIVIPKQTGGTAVASCPERKLEECLGLGENKFTNLPLVREGRDLGPPFICLHGDDVGDLTSSYPSAETKALHQNHVLKPSHNVVPKERPIVFLHEDERALFKEPSPHVSFPIHELDGEVRVASGRISGAQDVVLSKLENPKSLPGSICPVEAEVISEKGLNANAPVSYISISAVLDETNRIEEERKLPAPVESKVISERGLNAPTSNISSFAMLDETNRIEEGRKSLAPVETNEKGLNAPTSNISSFAMLDESNRIEEGRESLDPVETKLISEKGLNAPIPNISTSSAMLYDTNRIEEGRKSLDVETNDISEKGLNAQISNISSSAMFDETNRIEEGRKSLAPVEIKVISEDGLNATTSNSSSSEMLDETNRIEEGRKSIAPVETKVISEEGLNAPTSNSSSSEMLDETNRVEEKSKSPASSYRKQLSKSGMKLVSMTEKTSLPPSCDIDDQREEIYLSNSISKSIKRVTEGLHMRQIRIPTLVTPSQASVCGTITGDERTEAPDGCRDSLSGKEISSPLTPKSSIKSPLVAIAQDEQVVDPPKPLAHNVSRPTATRTPFRPCKDIQWRPPKRNIQFLGKFMKKMMTSPGCPTPIEKCQEG